MIVKESLRDVLKPINLDTIKREKWEPYLSQLNQIEDKIDIKKYNTEQVVYFLMNSPHNKSYSGHWNKKERDSLALEQIRYTNVLFSIDYVKAKIVFGQQNTTFKAVFYYKIWAFEYKEHMFLLFSDGPRAGKGSSIEIVTDGMTETYKSSKQLYDIVMEFREIMYNIFK